jgi:hypothetical protein
VKIISIGALMVIYGNYMNFVCCVSVLEKQNPDRWFRAKMNYIALCENTKGYDIFKCSGTLNKSMDVRAKQRLSKCIKRRWEWRTH